EGAVDKRHAGGESGGDKHPAPGTFRTRCSSRGRANYVLVARFSNECQNHNGSSGADENSTLRNRESSSKPGVKPWPSPCRVSQETAPSAGASVPDLSSPGARRCPKIRPARKKVIPAIPARAACNNQNWVATIFSRKPPIQPTRLFAAKKAR